MLDLACLFRLYHYASQVMLRERPQQPYSDQRMDLPIQTSVAVSSARVTHFVSVRFTYLYVKSDKGRPDLTYPNRTSSLDTGFIVIL